MWTEMHWNLLILVGVLCQGIIGTLSDKNIEESSDLLVRQKRVINRIEGEDVRENIRNFPYVVSVRRLRSEDNCVGVILTENIVLTASKCVESEAARSLVKVYSGSALIFRGGHPIIHNIIEKRIYCCNHQFRSNDGFALLAVAPPFAYSVNTRNIGLYEGHNVTPGTNGIVTGWGCNPPGTYPGTEHPFHLRSITVPIISKQDCAQLYAHTFPIVEGDICTLDTTGRKYCGVDDVGAPLVITVGGVYKLIGIHLWNGGVVGRHNPDVFIDLLHPIYRAWIMETIHSLEALVNNPNRTHHLPHHPHIE